MVTPRWVCVVSRLFTSHKHDINHTKFSIRFYKIHLVPQVNETRADRQTEYTKKRRWRRRRRRWKKVNHYFVCISWCCVLWCKYRQVIKCCLCKYSLLRTISKLIDLFCVACEESVRRHARRLRTPLFLPLESLTHFQLFILIRTITLHSHEEREKGKREWIII